MAPQPDSIYRLISSYETVRRLATVIDVAIVDPASPSYLAKESDTKSDVAAGQREADKRARWAESDWGSRWSDICTICG